MHTRRLASFLIGSWLTGILLMAFVVTPAVQREAEAVVTSPPSQLAKDIEDLGADVARLMLNYHANEVMRFIQQTWSIAQLGMAGAILAAVLFTAHRSRFLVIIALVMLILVSIQTLYLVPALRVTGRAFDFLPPAANSPERESYHTLHVWYQLCEVFKFLAGLLFAGRLVIDFYAWQDRTGEPVSTHGRRRRRRRTSDGSLAESKPQPPAPGPAVETNPGVD